jgi:hypothetical protein
MIPRLLCLLGRHYWEFGPTEGLMHCTRCPKVELVFS